MPRSLIVVLGSAFLLMILCVTALIALGRDANGLIGFLGATIIPGMLAAFAASKSTQAKAEAVEAKQSAKQAVKNTNGRLTQVLDMLVSQGKPLPDWVLEFQQELAQQEDAERNG